MKLGSKIVLILLFAVLFISFSENLYVDYVDYDSPVMNFFDTGKKETEYKWSSMSFRITMVAALLFGMVFYMEVERIKVS